MSVLCATTIAFVLGLPLCSCAGAAAVSASQLHSRLLTSSQLPAGWTVQSVPSNGIGCLANLIEPQGITVTAASETDFTANQGLPEVVERLATYPNTAAAYRGIVTRLAACKQVKGEIDGVALKGALTPVAFGHYGARSAAFAATFTGQGEELADDVAIVRRGNVIMGIDEGGYAPIDAHQFQGIVSTAAKKIS